MPESEERFTTKTGIISQNFNVTGTSFNNLEKRNSWKS